MCGGCYNRNAIISCWVCRVAQVSGLAGCLHRADQPIGRHVDVETPSPPSRQQLENFLQALSAICGVSFEGIVAERARLAYCAHWRADNENPALTSFLKLLGERYPLPTVGG
jgi:hypothetical protein